MKFSLIPTVLVETLNKKKENIHESHTRVHQLTIFFPIIFYESKLPHLKLC